MTSSRALVSGANSGIGLRVAQKLIERGDLVIASDLLAGEGLQSLAAQGAEVLRGDQTDEGFRAELVQAAQGVDMLANCAGIIRLKPLPQLEESDWDAVFDINAKATFLLTNALSATMPGGSSIVNVSSMSARRANNSETAVYAASKAAMLSFTRSQAHALAPRGIRVNAVLPGLIDTPMQDKVILDTASARGAEASDLARERLSDVPLGRLGTADEVAELIAWLLSPANSYMTGQSIAVDGGMTMY